MTVKKSAELEGVELDIATALALGFEPKLSAFETLYWSASDWTHFWYNGPVEEYKPTKNWSQAGGFIDDFGIEFKWVSDATLETYSYVLDEKRAHGDSHLESACRLVVINLLGDEVEIPDEVLEAYNGKSSS